MRGNPGKVKLPLTQKFSHGVGHILNDLAANAWFSYLLLYLTKVAGLSNSHAGYVAMGGQVIDGICTPFTAIANDKTVCRYGRRKVWHLIGWVLVCITFPLLFTRLLPNDTSAALKLVYYISIAGLFQFGWGCMQISHLSLIPEISRRDSERVELNAIRSALRFVCGIFVFGVTWILLGRSSEESISPGMWKQFMQLSFIIVGTGSVFNAIFHIWTKEPPSEALLRWKEERRHNRQVPKRGRDSNETNGAVCQLEPSGTISSPHLVVKMCDGPVTSVESANEKSRKEKPCEEKPCKEIAEEEISRQEIVDRDDVCDTGRTRIQWLKRPVLYKTGLIYIGTRLYVNISQAYFPLYLIETMKFQKEAIAYFPLVVLVAGVLASVGVKPLTKRFGSKITFCLGAIMAVSASFWFNVQPLDGRNAVYATAVLMGSGGSVMLITSLSMIAQLIGQDKKSGAFVYGAIGFFDKVVSGIVIAIIQECNPRSEQSAECSTCDDFLRNVQSIAPGAPVVLVTVLVIFDSVFSCKKRVPVTHVATQTSFDENENDRSDANIAPENRYVYENKGVSIGDEDDETWPTALNEDTKTSDVDIEKAQTNFNECQTIKGTNNEAVPNFDEEEHEVTKTSDVDIEKAQTNFNECQTIKGTNEAFHNFHEHEHEHEHEHTNNKDAKTPTDFGSENKGVNTSGVDNEALQANSSESLDEDTSTSDEDVESTPTLSEGAKTEQGQRRVKDDQRNDSKL